MGMTFHPIATNFFLRTVYGSALLCIITYGFCFRRGKRYPSAGLARRNRDAHQSLKSGNGHHNMARIWNFRDLRRKYGTEEGIESFNKRRKRDDESLKRRQGH